MPPWSIGNTLVVTRHAVSMLSVMSPKDGIFRIGLSARASFLLFIFMCVYVLAVQKY